MSILDLFRKAKQVNRRSGFLYNGWESPPDKNVRGLLGAYSEIYSLFGITLRIATALSEVKWRLYKGSERSERSQVAEHPILNLLDYANEFQTGQEIMELTSIHMDLGGRAYWYLPRNGLRVPGEIWVLAPHLMKPVPSRDNFISGYVYRAGNEQIPFDKSEIIRFPMPDPLNQLGGVGYAQAAAIELDSEAYAGRWNRNFFYNSARPDGAIETEENLTPEQFEQLKEQWQSRHGGLGRAHKVAILEGGMKYQQIQLSQKDMDFSQLRKTTRENIMFAFGIPQSVMGVSENVNRANAEAGDYTFARWLVKPRLTRIKNKLNEALIPMFPMAKGVEIDFDEVVPETIEQKKMLAETGLKSGFMTINEGRKLTGLDPIPSGDVLLIPLNMIPSPANETLEYNPPPEAPKSKGFSEEQKESRWKSYILKTERIESKFRLVFRRLLINQRDEVLRNYETQGRAEFDYTASVDKFKKSFIPVISLAYEEGKEDAVKQPDPHSVEWIEKRAGELVTGINKTTQNSLRIALKEGLEQGEDSKKIARRIRGFFDETYRGRAQRIARTEIIAASNEGALAGYEENGIQKAEFYTALDERTCEECSALHGDIYPIDEAHGIIPVHPGCRCTYIPIV